MFVRQCFIADSSSAPRWADWAQAQERIMNTGTQGSALFGFGLTLSNMIAPEMALSFLQGQNFGLMLVMGGAVCITARAYQFASRLM